MSPEKQWQYHRLGKMSRRGFLRGAAAFTITEPVWTRARKSQANRQVQPVLTYVGTYSSRQGPEGAIGHGEGIYLFEMSPATGALVQREVFGNDSNPAWLAFDSS